MNLRLTAILASIALLLGLAVAFWGRDDARIRSRYENARRAFRFDAPRIERLLIQTGDLDLECQRRQDQWRLTRPVEARADAVAIERLLGGLQDLSRGDIILPPRHSPDPYGPYGLDTPRIRLSLVEGGATNQILIGRRTPLGDGVYVRQAEQAAIARLHANLLDLLPTSVEAVRDRSLLNGEAAAIDRLDIRTPTGFIQLARDGDGTWRMFQPVTARADSTAIAALIDNLLAGHIVQFVQDGVSDLAPYGLDNHGAVTVVLNSDSHNGTQMLALGDPLPNAPTLVYARLQAEPSVYAVPAELRAFLDIRPDDLRDRRLPNLTPQAVQHFRIADGESCLEFTRDEAGQWLMVAPFQTPADHDAVDALLQSWGDIRIIAFESPPLTNPPLLSRSLSIDMRDARQPPLGLQMGRHPQNTNQFRLVMDDDPLVAIASPPRMIDLPLDPFLYRSREVLSIPPGDMEAITIRTSDQSLTFARQPATSEWAPDAPWMERVRSQLAPLRAQSIFASHDIGGMGFDAPYLSLTVRLRGQTGLAATLLVGAETTPGGPRWATLRGRDFVFALAPEVVAALYPPAAATPE